MNTPFRQEPEYIYKKAQHNPELIMLLSAALLGWEKLDFMCRCVLQTPIFASFLNHNTGSKETGGTRKHEESAICWGEHNNYLLLLSGTSCFQYTDLEQGLLGAKNRIVPLNFKAKLNHSNSQDVNLWHFFFKLQTWSFLNCKHGGCQAFLVFNAVFLLQEALTSNTLVLNELASN